MKAIEKNLSQHDNGTFYFVARRGGKLLRQSLKTNDLGEARRKLASLAVDALAGKMLMPKMPPVARIPLVTSAGTAASPFTGHAPIHSPAPAPVITMMPPVAAVMSAPPALAVARPTIQEAIAEHARGVVILTQGTKEQTERCQQVVARYATSWETFSPAEIWTLYRESRMDSLGKPLGSACNHLRVYMRKFVPWCIKRGYLGADAQESLDSIKQVVVNPRQIQVPKPREVDELLKMIATEHPEGAQFLRLLAVTGLRREGALSLEWPKLNFRSQEMNVKQKGGKFKTIPFTSEALEIFEARRKAAPDKPFNLTLNDLEIIERRLKKYARGLDVDLLTFHSFRHYFASRCLMDKMTVQEVAKLLGHSDGGQLVLRTYGHICNDHLRDAVSKLRLASGED